METITEDYVSFEVARLLREKGFNVLCNAYYDCFTTDNFHNGYEPTDFNSIDTKIRNIVSAPTQSIAMKWLREEKGVYIEISIVGVEWEAPTKWYFGWRCQTKDVIDRLRRQNANYTSYEEACEAAIKYCLKNLI